jgi:hypothetical protein
MVGLLGNLKNLKPHISANRLIALNLVLFLISEKFRWTMGKAVSQLTSRKDEDKPILPDNPAMASQAANYFSTGSSKPAHSCMPYEKAASSSFVTCPTCQGNGEIPQGE